MPRRPRVLVEGFIYHLYDRAGRGGAIIYLRTYSLLVLA